MVRPRYRGHKAHFLMPLWAGSVRGAGVWLREPPLCAFVTVDMRAACHFNFLSMSLTGLGSMVMPDLLIGEMFPLSNPWKSLRTI